MNLSSITEMQGVKVALVNSLGVEIDPEVKAKADAIGAAVSGYLAEHPMDPALVAELTKGMKIKKALPSTQMIQVTDYEVYLKIRAELESQGFKSVGNYVHGEKSMMKEMGRGDTFEKVGEPIEERWQINSDLDESMAKFIEQGYEIITTTAFGGGGEIKGKVLDYMRGMYIRKKA